MMIMENAINMDDLVVPPLLWMEEFLHQLDNSIGNYKTW